MTDQGRYEVGKHWGRPAVYDGSYLPRQLVREHQTEADAQAHADQLNTPRPAPQRAQQDALFDIQEA